MQVGWRSWTISSALSWLMKVLLIGLLPYAIYAGDYLIALLTCFAIVVSFVPTVLERNNQVHLPFEFDLLITLGLFLHTFLGEWLMFYERVWLWDKALHMFSSGVISLIAFTTVYTLHYTGKLRLTIPFVGFFTVIFALAIGVVWEMVEFLIDVTLELETQRGLTDTMLDLFYDLFGGLIAAVLGMVYVRYSAPETRKRFTRPLGEVFGRGVRSPARRGGRGLRRGGRRGGAAGGLGDDPGKTPPHGLT